jgi:dimethylamine--corrinoid protein Co-methyltransferase
VGDPLATEATHAIAACMGGMRTAGDLVLRVQLQKKLRINEAKQYVADKLNLTIEELCDVTTMTDVREQHGFGLSHFEPYAASNIGMEAKFKISESLGISINSVERFKERAGL